MQNTQGIIFVVDSNDRERIDDTIGNKDCKNYVSLSAKEELHSMLQDDDLQDAVLLVFANKTDLPHSMSTSEMTQRLGLHHVRNRKWKLQPTCALTGDGLYQGLDWLQQTLTGKK